MAIPTHDGKIKIASTRELPGLKGFDAKEEYGTRTEGGVVEYYNNKSGKRIIPMLNKKTETIVQYEMGVISNLITDMTLGGADDNEKARAVRHSQVVIDAAKHKLDYKQSEIDNQIKSLVNKYQRKIDKNGRERSGGASTIISKASSKLPVLKRQGTLRLIKKVRNGTTLVNQRAHTFIRPPIKLTYERPSLIKGSRSSY